MVAHCPCNKVRINISKQQDQDRTDHIEGNRKTVLSNVEPFSYPEKRKYICKSIIPFTVLTDCHIGIRKFFCLLKKVPVIIHFENIKSRSTL
jgi:hypothetical protein